MTEYQHYTFENLDYNDTVSKMYQDLNSEFKITSTDLSTSALGVKTLLVWNTLKSEFERYYATREIGGETEYDFFCMLQSCLNRNADTFERHLDVYDDDVAKPILGRTETVTYNTTRTIDRDSSSTTDYDTTDTNTQSNSDTVHNVNVPANAPTYDTDASRTKTDYGRTDTLVKDGTDTTDFEDDSTDKMTGTVTTELSDLGVRPNYETLNGFLYNNKTYIQFFIECFEECFAPRYKRIYF